MPMRSVHADDSQNALAIDFLQPVDGGVFDRLPNELPQWISMAYANFDNGVIRSPRPVTFLTRGEGDGFSLRIIPRGPIAPPPVAQAAPPPIRGSYGDYPGSNKSIRSPRRPNHPPSHSMCHHRPTMPVSTPMASIPSCAAMKRRNLQCAAPIPCGCSPIAAPPCKAAAASAPTTKPIGIMAAT
jgi:hypothetical protein